MQTVALHTAEPVGNQADKEVSYPGYRRQEIKDGLDWTGLLCVFPMVEEGGAPVVATHFSIAESDGTILRSGYIMPGIVCEANMTPGMKVTVYDADD